MGSEKQVFFEKAYLSGAWTDGVLFSVQDGRISKIEKGVRSTESAENVSGYALPGMVNVHSHAFQRAFSGLSEFRTAENDSFWTWRKLMYEFLEKVTPEKAYDIAKGLYEEMRQAGYSAVGEFHYLHHQPDGKPYSKITEMADAVINAAVDANIRICILPVLYQRGGFDDRELSGGQLRFGSSNDLYLQMLSQLKADWNSHQKVEIGVALHSLRAVSIANARTILEQVEELLPGCPIHIHIAEQVPEVEECLVATGKRPVELLLDSFDVNSRWCLIHATHLNDEEVSRMASSGAIAGICPTTEANLGDGIFRGKDFFSLGGQSAVGSDSHISVSMCSELRLLEYSQRLLHRQRAILCDSDRSCGNFLYQKNVQGGAIATGLGSGELSVGDPADFLVLNSSHSFFQDNETDRWLDYVVFSEVPGDDLFEVLSL